MPTFGSLFAGVGGIDLGLERAGWECRWQVEWDPFCQHVLAHHWPDVPRYGDITAVDWSGVERVDLLAGGFPCQPFSAAGRQAAQADPRWLWPEFRRAIRALRPALVLVENVPGLLAVNDGTAFGDVLGDLAESGYDAEWDCLPASAFGALHERDRVWLVAYPQSDRRPIRWEWDEGRDAHSTSGEPVRDEPSRDGHRRGSVAMADSSSNGREPRRTGDATEESRRREPDRSGEHDTLAHADFPRLEGHGGGQS